MNAGMVADAVALTESGVLVNGLCATDLLSGLEVAAEAGGGEEVDGDPDFRGSGVPLRRLESVRELVEEVIEARAADPELTSANPVTPRRVFPWGIGATTSDVLVVGPDKEVTASYLRVTGLRARTVDVARALQLSGDLAVARSDAAEGVVESDDGAETAGREQSERPGPRSIGGMTGIAAATVLVALAVVAGVVRLTDPGAGPAPVTAVQPAPADSADRADSAGDATQEAWRQMAPDGRRGEASPGETPAVNVAADVDGWEITETTAERAIWTSAEDTKMRVLLAAVPTPVETQEGLDEVMLRALDSRDGDGVSVTSRSPVSYEERFEESTTVWQVRLVDGHQVSVGCQYREFSPVRTETCDRFAVTARVR